jgi:hypothetical protein
MLDDMEDPMTLSIDLIDSGALNLLRDMERLNLIRVNTVPQKEAEMRGKLSERFAGSLHLSASKYAAFQDTLREGRNEWERDIY